MVFGPLISEEEEMLQPESVRVGWKRNIDKFAGVAHGSRLCPLETKEPPIR